MLMMSNISPADEKGGEVTAVITPPPSVSEHTPTSAPPLSSLQFALDIPPTAPPLPVDVGSPIQQKWRVRSFYWKPIPEERVHQHGAPNLWTLGHAAGKHMFHIDIKNLEELFAQSDDRPLHKATSIKTSRAHSTLQGSKMEITILDSKRSMNLAIFLKRFKRPYKSIMEDLLHGNSAAFGPEALRELLKFLPESTEVEKLHAYRGDPAQLAMADSFMYHLTLLPSFDLRIEALLLKEEFSPLCSSLKQDICTVRYAARELLGCVELHSVLHLVLEAGNIMNSGGYRGNAAGFKLSSLLALADTKANKPGMTLLHFVALEAKKKDEQLLKFPEKLQHVESAARVSVEGLAVEWEGLSQRMKRLEQNAQTNAELQEQFHTFLQNSATVLEDISKNRSELQKAAEDLINFFCEDKETFRLEDCFHIFQHFCSKFRKAVQENIERESRKKSQMKHLKELEDKSHSWRDGRLVHGVFGSRCRSETDVQAAVKGDGLLQLLNSHPQSSQSTFTLGQFGRLRGSRQELSEGNPDCAGSDTDTHSLALRRTATDSNKELQFSTAAHRQTSSGQMGEHIEVHTLVPALQSFSPLLDGNHCNAPESSQDDTTVNVLEINNKVDPQTDAQSDKWMMKESKNSAPKPTIVLEPQEINTNTMNSDTMQVGTKAQMGETNLKHPENNGETSLDTNPRYKKDIRVSLSENDSLSENNSLFAVLLNDPSDVKSIRDSTESNSQTIKSTSQALASSSKESESHIKANILRQEHTQVHRSHNKKITTSNPAVPSSSSNSSPFSKPLHPVRTLTSSEFHSMRRVVPLGRKRRTASSVIDVHSQAPRAPIPAIQKPSFTAPPAQRSSTRTAPLVLRSSTRTAPPAQKSSTRTPPPVQRSSTRTALPAQTSSTRTAPPVQRSSTRTPPPAQTSFTRTPPPVQRSSTRTAPPAQRSSTRTAPPAQTSSTRTAPLVLRSSTRTAPPAQTSSTRTAPPAQTSSTRTAPLVLRSSTRTAPPAQTSSTRTAPPAQRSSTRTAPPAQRSSTRTAPPVQRSSAKKVQQKSFPEEKMCRSTMHALTQPSGENSGATSAPSFARNTVASTTRSTVACGNLLVSQSTMGTTPKVPSLNRTAFLRLSQSRMNPQIMPGSKLNPNKAGNVCLPSTSGHIRRNMSSFSTSSQVSLETPLKPAWK